MRKNYTVLISPIVSLVIAFAVLITAVFAWFSISKTPYMDGTSLSLISMEDNGYSLESFDGDDEPDESYLIYPAETHILGITSISNNDDFGFRISVAKLSGAAFRSRFTDRIDLLYGKYQKKTMLTSTSGTVYENLDFDIDFYLTSILPALTKSEINEYKVDFLYKLAQENSIHDALTVKIIRVDDVAITPITLLRNPASTMYKEVYYLDPQDLMDNFSGVIPFGTKLEVELSYGVNNYLPLINYSSGSIFETGEYSSLNYNCFIGQTLNVSFENKRDF